jgi:alanine-glyoxylate transaminase / serine-glyoxylate transaminase / serine-pyruvate transaminase
VVHLETSTTILNPIEQIGPVIRKHSGVFFVDAVSSLGGISMRMEDWCIDLCASATQKCLGAPPGLAPVAVGPRGWKAIDSNPAKGHGWYGDLRVWRQYAVEWGDWHPSPVTMATNNVVALGTALQQLMAEGIPQRLERYRRLALRLREGLAGIGMQPFTPLELMNPVITAAYGPKGVSTAKIVTHLAEKYHIKISGGLGALRETIFRIGHMSPVMTEADIDLVLDGLRTF